MFVVYRNVQDFKDVFKWEQCTFNTYKEAQDYITSQLGYFTNVWYTIEEET